jgi:hypothetical protein
MLECLSHSGSFNYSYISGQISDHALREEFHKGLHSGKLQTRKDPEKVTKNSQLFI